MAQNTTIDTYVPAILQGTLAARPDLTQNPSDDAITAWLNAVEKLSNAAFVKLQSYQAANSGPAPTPNS